MNGKELSWKISEGAFHLQDKIAPEVKVPILSEEVAYNKQLKQYKIFLTQRPMDPLYKVPPVSMSFDKNVTIKELGVCICACEVSMLWYMYDLAFQPQ